MLVIVDSVFFSFVHGLAHSRYGLRSIIGFHLFFSEIWFILFGNIIFALHIHKQGKISEANANVAPIFIVLFVVWLSFLWGLLNSNVFALRDFREIAFGALGLPAILCFAPYCDLNTVVRRLALLCIPIAIIWSPFAIYEHLMFADDPDWVTHNSFAIIMIFPFCYFLFHFLAGRRGYGFIALLIAFAIVARFSKVTLALLLFCSFTTILLSKWLNRKLIFKRLNRHVISALLWMIVLLSVLLLLVNVYSDGAIERQIRQHFLKERVASSGEIFRGDLSGGRFAIWTAAMSKWMDRPLFGHGAGAVLRVYSTGWIEKWQFHNYFFQQLHNTGAFGIVLIVGGWLFWWRRALLQLRSVENYRTKIALGCMAVFALTIMFYGFFGHPLSFPPVAQFFWVGIGFLCVSKSNKIYNIFNYN